MCFRRSRRGASRGATRMYSGPLVDSLLQFDPFLVLADFADYVACQQRVSDAWQDARRWTRMSIMNTARSGKFSSDRAISEYCEAHMERSCSEDRP